MKDSLTQITVVLDRSGSMADIRQATIDSFNEFTEGQKKVPGEANFTLIQFDTQNPWEVLCDSRPIAGAPKLSLETYQPRGGTPLHDAIGLTIDDLGKTLSRMNEADRPVKVVIVILTDGLENASSKYTGARIAEMIKHQTEVYKWQFVFLGANQDAILTGEKLNIPMSNSITFAASATGTANAVSSTSRNLANYRTGATRSLAYSKQDREDAVEN